MITAILCFLILNFPTKSAEKDSHFVFAWKMVKIDKKKNQKNIFFIKFMEKEVKKVGSPQDMKLWPKDYLILSTSIHRG